jgi:hypothetical protein
VISRFDPLTVAVDGLAVAPGALFRITPLYVELADLYPAVVTNLPAPIRPFAAKWDPVVRAIRQGVRAHELSRLNALRPALDHLNATPFDELAR